MFSEEIVRFVAISNIPASFTIDDLTFINGHPLQAEAQKIQQILRTDRSIGKLLEHEVARLRLSVLRQIHESPRPAPYTHPDLADLPIDKHGLIDASLLDSTIGGFAIGESVFEIIPAIDARNSSYWTWLSLKSLQNGINPRIRLDPLMYSPRKGYRSMCYKMNVFGQPLNWRKILNLRSDSMHRWMPDQPDSSDVAFTDAVWTPRDNEVHLRCEECPKPTASGYRAPRYFHSVIDRNRQTIIHCDGALRIFDDNESAERNDTHVRDAGKIGTRIKLFQIDDELKAENWTQLFIVFFIWNSDIEGFANALMAS